jgi:hypothetical protein
MPYTEEPIIIDRPDAPPPDQLTWLIYASMGVLAVGVLFHYMHWPFARYIVLIGFGGTTFYNGYLFFTKPRPFYAWAYFIGRLLLLAGILLYLFRLSPPIILFFLAMICFALGMLFSSKSSKEKFQDEQTKNNEDEDENLLL